MPEPGAGLQLRYVLDEDVDASPNVERWEVVAIRDGVEVGDASVLVLNLEPGMDVGDLVDRTSGTWRAPPCASTARTDEHVLVLDRVWVHPDHRGNGLGPVIAAAVIRRLGRGCHVAACYPAPLDGAEQTDDEWLRSVDALGAVWSTVGFRHWRDGVWMLDLN